MNIVGQTEIGQQQQPAALNVSWNSLYDEVGHLGHGDTAVPFLSP